MWGESILERLYGSKIGANDLGGREHVCCAMLATYSN